jgi:hypothetical protein
MNIRTVFHRSFIIRFHVTHLGGGGDIDLIHFLFQAAFVLFVYARTFMEFINIPFRLKG